MSASRYERRCHEVLDQAFEHVRAYEDWHRYDPGRDGPADTRYAALPVLTKGRMRDAGHEAFALPGRDVAQALAAGDIELVATSGTTDERIQNIWYQPWWDRSENASWKLNAHAASLPWGDHREAILTGPLQTGVPCEDGTLPMEQRQFGRFLYLNEKLSPAHWTPALMDRMLAELDRFQPVVLEANASLLARLARYAADRDRRVYQPRLIVLTYENPTRLARREIARAFTAPVASSYGATEAGYVFMECGHGKLHQVTESCRVDLVPWEHANGGQPVFRILATTFDNPWRVLLRFDMGDLACVSESPCACGNRDGLVLDTIEGRAGNVTFAVDGSAVTADALDRAMVDVPGLFDYQVVQSAPARIAARVMDGSGVDTRLKARVEEALRQLYGPADLDVAVVEQLSPTPSGKFQRVHSSSLDRCRHSCGHVGGGGT